MISLGWGHLRRDDYDQIERCCFSMYSTVGEKKGKYLCANRASLTPST